jgi:hypothetical protein
MFSQFHEGLMAAPNHFWVHLVIVKWFNCRNLCGGWGRPARKAAISEPIVWKMWKPRRLTALLASKGCYRDSFTFYHFQLQLDCLMAYRYFYSYSFNAAFLKKPTIAQTVKVIMKFITLCGTRSFIITDTSSGQWIPSRARRVQTTPIHCFLKINLDIPYYPPIYA